MTDVLGPVFIPYARFLEVRARRLRIVAELTPPDGQPTSVAVCAVPVATTNVQHAPRCLTSDQARHCSSTVVNRIRDATGSCAPSGRRLLARRAPMKRLYFSFPLS